MSGEPPRPGRDGPRKRLKRSDPTEGAGKRFKRASEAAAGKSKALRKPRKRRGPVLSEWMLVRTKARRERYAKRNVERQGHEAFLPDYQEEGSPLVEILFPGYLFVRGRLGQWRFLEGTFGVTAIVMQGERPALVPLRDMRELRGMCDKDGTVIVPTEQFKRGQKIKVKKGSFQGLLGVYIRGARDRVSILFRILGKEVETELPKAALTGALTDQEKAQLDWAKVR